MGKFQRPSKLKFIHLEGNFVVYQKTQEREYAQLNLQKAAMAGWDYIKRYKIIYHVILKIIHFRGNGYKSYSRTT